MNLNKTTYSLADLYELRDLMEDRGAPQWQLDNMDAVIQNAQKMWVDLAADQYGKTADRMGTEVEEITRVANKLAEAAAEVLEDMHNGRISEAEAGKASAAIQRDLNKLRRQLPDVERHESRVWESVDVDPDEYQQQVMDRFPALAARARIALDEEELNRRPARRRGRRSAPVEEVDESDLARGGFPGSRRQS